MQSYGISDIGKIRQNNEDSFCISSSVYGLYIVADGMGGHNAGEVASNLAISIVENYLSAHIEDDKPYEQILEQAFRNANNEVYNMSINNHNMSGMGTTLTLVLLRDEKLYFCHVGDSRVYILKNNNFTQITTDHTLVEELYQSGNISAEELKTHPQKNIITNAVGTDIICNLDIDTLPISNIKKILLCTDGLTNYLTDDEIRNIINQDEAPQIICEKLIDMANNRGGDDNITVVVISID